MIFSQSRKFGGGICNNIYKRRLHAMTSPSCWKQIDINPAQQISKVIATELMHLYRFFQIHLVKTFYIKSLFINHYSW